MMMPPIYDDEYQRTPISSTTALLQQDKTKYKSLIGPAPLQPRSLIEQLCLVLWRGLLDVEMTFGGAKNGQKCKFVIKEGLTLAVSIIV